LDSLAYTQLLLTAEESEKDNAKFHIHKKNKQK